LFFCFVLVVLGVARSARACNFRNKRSGATDFVELFCSVSELARQKVLRVGRRQGKARGLSDRAVLCMEKQVNNRFWKTVAATSSFAFFVFGLRLQSWHR